METADILTFLGGLVSGSLLTLGFNYVRQEVFDNREGRFDGSKSKSDQRKSRVGGDQAGRDIRK